MSEKVEPTQSRREMCRSAARCLALGGIVVLSGGLIARDIARAGADRCAKTGTAAPATSGQQLLCRDCAALAACALPAAAAARKAEKR